MQAIRANGDLLPLGLGWPHWLGLVGAYTAPVSRPGKSAASGEDTTIAATDLACRRGGYVQAVADGALTVRLDTGQDVTLPARYTPAPR